MEAGRVLAGLSGKEREELRRLCAGRSTIPPRQPPVSLYAATGDASRVTLPDGPRPR
jgi:hypothetical protein